MPAYQFSPFAIPAAVTAALLLLFAIVLVLTRFSRISIAMFSISVAAAAWQIACVFMDLAVDAPTALRWARVGSAIVPFLAPAVYQLVVSLLDIAGRRRVVSAVAWFIAAQFAIAGLTTTYVVSGVRHFRWGFYPTFTLAGRVLHPLLFGVLLALAIVELSRAYPSSKGTERSRMRLFVIAIAVGSVAAVDLLPAIGIAVYPFGWAALLSSVGVVIYTARKYGLTPINPSPAAA
jgi:hypothetical protein